MQDWPLGAVSVVCKYRKAYSLLTGDAGVAGAGSWQLQASFMQLPIDFDGFIDFSKRVTPKRHHQLPVTSTRH